MSRKVTAEDILNWHGSDHSIEELAETMAEIVNGEYSIEGVKEDILNSSDEEFEPLDLEEGVETKWGTITMKHAMIDTDGTNLADGIEIRLDGNLIGEAIGYTSSKIESFETIEDVENFVDKHCDF